MEEGGSAGPPGRYPTLPARWAAILAFAAGFGGWIVVSNISHRREAWDSGLYWSGFIPLLFLLSAILGFLSPRRSWHWGLWMAGGQLTIMFLLDPSGSLLPLGVILFGVLGGVIGVPGLIAAQFRRRREMPLPPFP